MRARSHLFVVEEIFLAGQVSGEARGVFISEGSGDILVVDRVDVESAEFCSNTSGDIIQLAESDMREVARICRELIERAIDRDGVIGPSPMVLSANTETAENISAALPPEVIDELSVK